MNPSELFHLQSALIDLILLHEVSRSTVHHFEIECRVKVVFCILILVSVIFNNFTPIK